MASDQRLRRLSPPSASPPDTAAPSPSFPVDLIPAVAGRLTTLEDFFALRASCRSYRALLPPCRSTLASQAPLPRATYRYTPAALFHLSLRRRLRFRLPWIRHPYRCTLFYAHGFLVTKSFSPKDRELLLFHLFSGEQLRLPNTPPPPPKFSRVDLSGDLLTVLFLPRSPTVQSCRPGDAFWQVASVDATEELDDLRFLNATLYALLGEGRSLAVVKLLENSLELSFLGGESDELSRRSTGHDVHAR